MDPRWLGLVYGPEPSVWARVLSYVILIVLGFFAPKYKRQFDLKIRWPVTKLISASLLDAQLRFILHMYEDIAWEDYRQMLSTPDKTTAFMLQFLK